MSRFIQALRGWMRWTVMQLLASMPHQGVCQVLGLWARLEQIVHSRLFERHRSCIQQMLTDGRHGQLNRLTRRSRAYNFFHPWRLVALATASDQDFAGQVRVRGLEFVRDQVQANRGIILLNCHFRMGHAVPLVLARLGLSNIYSFQCDDFLSKIDRTRLPGLECADLNHRGLKLLPQLYVASQRLQNGGMLHLTGDGRRDEDGLEVTFLGRQCRFSRAFADIALHTEATVIPAFGLVAPGGEIDIRLHPPLDAGHAESSQQERANSLVAQYVQLLEHYCRSHPENVLPWWFDNLFERSGTP